MFLETGETVDHRKPTYRISISVRIRTKLEGKRALGRSEDRWEDNINMDHRKMGFGCML